MLIANGKYYDLESRSFKDGDILIADGKISAVGKGLTSPDGDVFDANGKYIVPGFIDVHTHGRSGYDFCLGSKADLAAMARSYAQRGVTTVMPTIASAPFDDMMAALNAINSFAPSDDGASFCGVHIEGRYLNPEKKGAHAPEMLSALNPSELDNAAFAGCSTLHISAAFELDKNFAFAKKALSIGATLGLGHSAANYAEAVLAEQNGITAYTHLFNAMPPLHHRDGGAVCAALLGDAYAELICDGIHVSEEMVRLTAKAKGTDTLVLISDSMEATGCPDGEYSIAGNPVTVKNGKALTHGGALAGSTLTLDTALENLMSFASLSLAEALPAATANPAKEIGIFDRVGSIEVGKQADLLVLSDITGVNIERVILRGKAVK